MAIALSVTCHAALLLFFVHFAQDSARIAGGEQSGVVMIGNADQNQLRSGEMAEPNVTHVSLISVSKAMPVETATVAPAVAVEALEPAETVEAVPPSQVISPVEEAPAEPETAVAAAIAPATQANVVPADAVPAAPPPNDVPSVLTTDQATAVAAPETVAAATETAEAAKPVAPARIDPSESVAAMQPVEETASAQPIDMPALPQQIAAIPSPAKRARPVEKNRKAPARKPEHVEPKAAHPHGSHGKGSTDQRRGRAEGTENGHKAAASTGRAASSEGNAAVSNYPGKIVRKLRRALRYPAGAGSRRLRGVAQVRFVVSSGGGVGSIRLVASSGSTILDEAALNAVKRAAPFPPIPTGAGRSSWQFTVPLAFVR